MECQEDVEILPVPVTPDLKLNIEEQHWFWALTLLKQIIVQVVERMGENLTSPEHESLTEFSRTPGSINTPETESETEPEQPPLTPDMSPIVRPQIESIKMSMPCFPLSETKLSVLIDKTQDITLELLISTAEIYLAQKEVSQNKEKESPAHSSKPK